MLKILIVDDDPLTRKGIQVLMPWEKHHMKIVGECSNGKDALTFLEQTMVDLVLVDIDMPVMDGITFMKTAAKLYPELNYVVLTVHTEFDYIQNVLRLGAMDYIAKTQFDKENFDEILNRIHTGIIHKRASFSGSGDLKWKETQILYPSIFALVSAEVESDNHVFEFWERNGLSGKKDIYELMGGVWVFIAENNSFVFPDSFSLFMLLRIWDVSEMTYAQLGKLLRRFMKDSFFYEYQPVCLVHDIQAYELCEKGPTADAKTVAQTREALLALKWVYERSAFDEMLIALKSRRLKKPTLTHWLLEMEGAWNFSFSRLTGETISLPPVFHCWMEVENWLIQVYKKQSFFNPRENIPAT